MDNQLQNLYLFLALLLIANGASDALTAKKDQRYGSVIVGQVRTVYDGDTFYADIHGWPDIIGKKHWHSN
ncbi:MAG: hypothetical protein MI976_11275 [Pseudomonadales bacterium]|nr:hypothetical protein [Pseudomonadales bacterium]